MFQTVMLETNLGLGLHFIDNQVGLYPLLFNVLVSKFAITVLHFIHSTKSLVRRGRNVDSSRKR